MALGYLVKKAANGIVVILEKMVDTPQGRLSNFSVDDDTTWIFPSWEGASAWLALRFREADVPPSVTQIRGQ